jgi:hypothetical protein
VYCYLRHKDIAQAQKSPSNGGFSHLRAGAQECFGRGTEVFASTTKGVAATMREPDCPAHSGLMFAARTTVRHFSVSWA